MSQKLTVYRRGSDWAARDVTGSNYGQSPDLFKAIEAAERLARKIGATVVLSREAQNHLLSQPKKPKG
jgi:hypothetical protein